MRSIKSDILMFSVGSQILPSRTFLAMATTTKCQPTNYEETDPVDHSLFGPIAISNDDDFMKELTREWDERRNEATMFFRRVSFSGEKIIRLARLIHGNTYT